jgi:hypothetical protein
MQPETGIMFECGFITNLISVLQPTALAGSGAFARRIIYQTK